MNDEITWSANLDPTTWSTDPDALRLVMTGRWAPEQYDVFRGDTKVAYLRLRHGYFTAEMGDALVYDAATDGDGAFAAQSERDHHLTTACAAILARLKNPTTPTE